MCIYPILPIIPIFVCSAYLPPPMPLRNQTSLLLPGMPDPRDFRFPLPRWTHRDEPLVARDAQDGVVGARSARRRVDEQVDVLVDLRRRRRLRKHDVQVRRAKHRLSRVECQPGQLGLD
jgi:hypothetical protein